MRTKVIDERNQFKRKYGDNAVSITLSEEALLEALERGLGIPDDVMAAFISTDRQYMGWEVVLIGPRFDEINEMVVPPRATLLSTKVEFQT